MIRAASAESASPMAKVMAFSAIYLIWGSTYLAIRMAIDTLPPFLMAGTRFVLAGVLLFIWARAKGAPAPQRGHWLGAAIAGTLMMFGGNGLVTWAEQWVPSGVAALLIATLPIWMAIVNAAFFGGPRPRGWMLGGMALGIIGVAVLVAPSENDVESLHPLGVAALLLAALCWSTGSLYSRGARLPNSPALATAMQMLCGGGVLLAVGSATGEWSRLDLGQVSLESGLAFLYLVFFGSIVALSAYVWLLRVSSAAAVSTYAFVKPVVAVFLGWGLAEEVITPRILLAAALIVSAVVAIQLTSRSRTIREVAPRAPEAAPSPARVAEASLDPAASGD